MSWKKLIFKQNQPIHIGSGKWGVLKETDIFISGQTMWGALTNAYFQKTQDYNETLFEKISNFFPSLDKENILAPHYKEGEFHLGDFSEEEFKAYFVDTLIQTAVEPISRKAKDESLHEIDYILPKPKKEFQSVEKLEPLKEQLYWIGIINTDNKFLKKGLKIYIGADSRYGYGELELIYIDNLAEEEKEFWWINGEEIKIENGQSSPYFIEAIKNLEFKGELLLLTELDFLQNIPKVNEAKFFINVGSKIQNSEQKMNLKRGKLYANGS
ncbi:hypothetical protein OWM07_00905 [Deferribacter thermophilus]|uniref:hypothetical protein n=1 Tax=Deferribacter thermophilus TaxID=53573 RepID=UPI003C17FF5E